MTPIKQVADRICHSGSTIFLFHRVLSEEDNCFEPELATNLAAFSDFLDWINEQYEVVPLDELIARRKEQRGQGSALCALTFDDGWLDNYRHAFPQLTRRKMAATIFLPLRFIGSRRRFWQELISLFISELQSDPSRITALEQVARYSPWFPPLDSYRGNYHALRGLLLTRPGRDAQEFAERLIETANLSERIAERAFINWDEVAMMQRNGISFGSHTMNHTILTNAPPADGDEEILASYQELSERLDGKITGFSYPRGAVGPSSIERVRLSGYGYAVTVRPGVIRQDTEEFLLPRIPISDSILNGGYNTFSPGKARISFAKNIVKHASTAVPFVIPNRVKKIKILFIADLITEWEGGTERQLHLVIQSLDRRYFEPKLCFLFDAADLPLQTLPCPLIVINPKESGRLSLLGRMVKLVQLLRRERPHIVQTFFREGNMVGIIAARLAGVPIIIGSVRNAGTWQKPIHRLIFRMITPVADRWQANSRALWRQQFQTGKLSARRIDILPNGSDLSTFKPSSSEERVAARRKLGFDEKAFICVSVANFAKVKDIPTLLQGAKLVQKSLPNCHFILVGDGDLRPELERQALSLGLNGSVRFVGRQADVRPFLAAADVGLLTSQSEGSSNAVIEYMAAGLPTILSRIEPNEELVQGLFFKPGDPADLAANITILANDQLLAESLSIENQRMAQEFSEKRFSERVQSYYSYLVSRG